MQTENVTGLSSVAPFCPPYRQVLLLFRRTLPLLPIQSYFANLSYIYIFIFGVYNWGLKHFDEERVNYPLHSGYADIDMQFAIPVATYLSLS